MMTTGFIVALGSAMPTAQESFKLLRGNYYATDDAALVLPSFFSSEPSALTIFLSYFPLTSPISLLLRNMLGTLSLIERFYWNLASCYFCDSCRVACSANLSLWNNFLWFKSKSQKYFSKKKIA